MYGPSVTKNTNFGYPHMYNMIYYMYISGISRVYLGYNPLGVYRLSSFKSIKNILTSIGGIIKCTNV